MWWGVSTLQTYMMKCIKLLIPSLLVRVPLKTAAMSKCSFGNIKKTLGLFSSPVFPALWYNYSSSEWNRGVVALFLWQGKERCPFTVLDYCFVIRHFFVSKANKLSENKMEPYSSVLSVLPCKNSFTICLHLHIPEWCYKIQARDFVRPCVSPTRPKSVSRLCLNGIHYRASTFVIKIFTRKDIS